VVLKPPEWAPLTASLLADITRDAGLPDGAFNVVQGIGEEAGGSVTRIADRGFALPSGRAWWIRSATSPTLDGLHESTGAER